MKIIIVILAAALIFLTLRIIRFVIKYLLNRYPRLDILGSFMIVAEFLIWLIFVFLAADFLFGEKLFYQYLVAGFTLIVLGLFTWFFIRDIFAGFIFRIKYNLKTGTFISSGNLSGQIKSQHLTSIKLKTTDGLILNIPYTKLINEIITEKEFRGTPEQHTLRIKADLSLGRTNAEELIRTALLTSPWSNMREEPIIRLVKEDERGYFFEITLFSVKMKNIKLIEIALDKVPSLNIVSQKRT